MDPDIIAKESNVTALQGTKNLTDHIKYKINESPGKAALIALGTGFCLNRLPIGTLISAPIKLTVLLAKPTLLALGAAKVYDIAQKQTRK